jgi:hypothetical protein
MQRHSWNVFPAGFLSMWGQNWPLTPHVQAMLAWYGHANLVLAGFQFFVTTVDAKSQAKAAFINVLFAPLTIYTCLVADTRGGLVFAVVDYAILAVLIFTSRTQK